MTNRYKAHIEVNSSVSWPPSNLRRSYPGITPSKQVTSRSHATIKRTKDFPKPNQNHFDILQTIFRTKNALPITVSYKHVEGHQATKYPGRELDQWGNLNEEMDALAKSYLDYSTQYDPLDNEVASNEWSVSIAENKICTAFKDRLSKYLRSVPIVQFWTQPTISNSIQKPPKFTLQQISILDISNTQIIWNKAT